MNTDYSLSQIEQHYPRIASALVLLWGNPEMDTYFNRIVIDERGDREGFPPEVMSEILLLATLHQNEYRFEQTKYDGFGVRSQPSNAMTFR